jgi:Vacuolar protein sorting-associated protein 62
LVHIRAAPDPEHVELAQKYAPQFRFHYDEQHFPSTVEYFLSGDVVLNDKNGPYHGAPSPLTNESIADLPDKGSGTYITANLDVELYDFFMGQNPETSQPTTYTFIDQNINEVVDLWYWIFCPFSSGKMVDSVGYTGYRTSAVFLSI